MSNEGDFSARKELLDLLMERVEQDTYPSVTMLDMIECLLEPDEVQGYVQALIERIRADAYPSIPMIRRVIALT